MNIVVKTFTSKYIVRPDTTWERDSEDFYPPEFVSNLSFSPVLFARICKPGRSISERFASRYFDGVNYGILLYPEDMIRDGIEDFACASCLDHTSFLPFPVFGKEVLGGADDRFCIYKGEELLFETGSKSVAVLENAISEASSYIYFRSGDILAIELANRSPLCVRNDGKVMVRCSFNRNDSTHFNIIF